jgi:hypothetical protein
MIFVEGGWASLGDFYCGRASFHWMIFVEGGEVFVGWSLLRECKFSLVQWKLTLPQQRASNESLPFLNKDHPMKTYPPSKKIIQWNLTLPQQRSSNENLPSFNKDHPMKTQQSSSNRNLPSLNKDHPMKIYIPSTKTLLRNGRFSLDDLCWGGARFHWMIFVEAVWVSLDDLCWGRVSFHWMIFVEGGWVSLDDICWGRVSFHWMIFIDGG